MLKSRIRLIRLAVLTALIVLSLLSGAWIHAYAFGNNDHAQPTQSNPTYSDGTFHPPNSAYASKKTMVDVCSGDTLWSIAAAHLPKNENIHSYINKIKKANGLKGSSLQAGQIIYLP